jgi:hypothetical protein
MEETVRQRVSVVASIGMMALLIFLAAKAYSWFTGVNENRSAADSRETLAPPAPGSPNPALRIWPEVVKDLESAKSMTVYALIPALVGDGSRTRGGQEIFDHYPVLGSVEVKPPERIRGLAKTLTQEVRFGIAFLMCFLPRHGIRADLPDGRRIDLLICYQCDQIEIHGAREALVHPGPSKAALDEILGAAGIDLDDIRRQSPILFREIRTIPAGTPPS